MKVKSERTKLINIPLPHEIWPPAALADELQEITSQRNKDISIRGKTGPIKEFEELFLEFLRHSARYAVSFNSGTSALLAAYFAIGIEENDEVLGPGLTYHAALSPVYTLKGSVKLVDIDLNTRCIDHRKIEGNITERTKAITVVHQWGYPAEMDAILSVAAKYNLKVIEDCSHAHGSKYRDRFCGTLGDVGVFSLQANKAIFAGEGGILVSNNETLYKRAIMLGHYRDRCKAEITDPELFPYWPSGFGLKLRMSPFNAIVAKHSLIRFPKIKKGRHECLQYFNKRLKEIDYLQPFELAGHVDLGAWYGFKPLYLREKLGITRSHLISLLQGQGMEVSEPSGECLARLPLYNDFPDRMFIRRTNKVKNDIDNLPVCVHVEENALSLPAFYDWGEHKPLIDQYIETFKRIKEIV